jgi:hypothetical protein
MKFLGVPGAFDYAGPTRARAIAIVRVAFRTCLLRRRPGCIFSQLNLPPRLFPCLRFAVHLAMPNAKLGAKVDRYSFFVRLLPPLLHTGLARRTNIAIALTNPYLVDPDRPSEAIRRVKDLKNLSGEVQCLSAVPLLLL